MPRSALSSTTRVAACLAVAAAMLICGWTGVAGATSPWISSASSMTCARDASNQMACWGGKGISAATLVRGGIASPDGSATTVPSLDVRQIAVGFDHACAVLPSGPANCWGENGSWELGDGTTADSAAAVRFLPAGVSARSVAVTNTGTCAVATTGVLWCSGIRARIGLANQALAPPNDTAATFATAVSIPGGDGVQQIAMGPANGCARLTGGRIACWGTGTSGQLGNGVPATSATPVLVDKIGVGFSITDLPKATDIAVGASHTCAALTDGTVACWGLNDMGQLGDGSPVAFSTQPVRVSGIANAVEVAAGGATTCARLSTAAIKCWGSNTRGALGTGSDTPAFSSTPVSVITIEDAAAIAVGPAVVGGTLSSTTSAVCALRTNRKAFCWGSNEYGELGLGTSDSTSHATPGEVPGYVGPGLPTAPTLAGAVIGDESVTATWDAATSATWGITGYTATAGPDGGSCTTDDAGRACTITGLRNGIEYDVTVTAQNGFGSGDSSTALKRVPGVVPTAPADVSASRVGDSARISWGAADGDGNAIRGYEAEVEGVGTCTATGDGRSCVVDGIEPLTTYSVRVRARNDIGWGPWSERGALGITRPGAPRIADVIAADGSLLIGWDAAPENGSPVIAYQACATPVSDVRAGATWTDACPSDRSTTCTTADSDRLLACTITGLDNDRRYRIAVRGRNSDGWGLPSARVTGRPRVFGPATRVTPEGGVRVLLDCSSWRPCRATMRMRIATAPNVFGQQTVTVPARETRTFDVPLPADVREAIGRGAAVPARLELTVRAGTLTGTGLLRLTAPGAPGTRGLEDIQGLFARSVPIAGRCAGSGIERCAGFAQLVGAGTRSGAVLGQSRFSVAAGAPIRTRVALDEQAIALLAERGVMDVRVRFAMIGGTKAPPTSTVRLWNVRPGRYELDVNRILRMQNRPGFLSILNGVDSQRIAYGPAAARLRREVLPGQRRALRAARALGNSSPRLNEARTLLIQSARYQVRSTLGYVAWLEGGAFTNQQRGLADDRTAFALRQQALTLIQREVDAARPYYPRVL